VRSRSFQQYLDREEGDGKMAKPGSLNKRNRGGRVFYELVQSIKCDDGEVVQLSKSFDTKEEGEANRMELYQELLAKVALLGKSVDLENKKYREAMTVRYYLEHIYLPGCRTRVRRGTMAAQTFFGYEGYVRNYIDKYPIADVYLVDLRPRLIKEHFEELSATVPGGARKAWQMFRTAINDAIDVYEMLEFSPLPKKLNLSTADEPYIAEVHDAESLSGLFQAFKGHRLEAYVLIGAGLGLRPSETCALWEDDIDFKSGEVTIDKMLYYDKEEKKVFESKRNKTVKSKGKMVLPDKIIARLEEILKEGMPVVPSFSDPGIRANPLAIREEYKRACKQFGVKYIPPKNLRNTFSTILDEQGAENTKIANAMRHEDLKMSYSHYTVSQTRQSREMAKLLNEAINL